MVMTELTQTSSLEPTAARAERPSLATMTKAEAVYVETRSRILSGALRPGLGVNQEALAADLGVSITPLREALRRLEMEGLIRLEAHRTIVIPPLTGRELDELYEIRMELDSLAAGLTADRASDAQVALIGELARQKPVHNPVVQLGRNRVFHRAIYGACENAALITYLEQLWDRTDRYRLILVKEEVTEGPPTSQPHIHIADAIGARRAKLAARLMREHIASSRARIALFIRPGPAAPARATAERVR
jgi:DNA-binding GntR family transcriptional regulator